MGRGRRAGRTPRAGPMRRCVGCRRSRPQRELLRLVVEGGQVAPDYQRRLPGRGCSLCPEAECAAKAAKARSIGRALQGKAPDPPLEAVLGWQVKASSRLTGMRTRD